MIANTETTPRIGLRHRQHDRPEQPERPGAVGAAPPRTPRAAAASKNRFTSRMLNAFARRRQPHREVVVEQRHVAEQRRVHDREVQRHEQHDRRDEQRREDRAVQDGRVPRAQHRQRVPGGRRDEQLEEPRAGRDHDRVPEVLVDVRRRSTPGGRFAQSMPFGQSARGWRSVSCVGVTADFASHSSGPRPAIDEPGEEHEVHAAHAEPHAALLAVVVRDDAAVGGLVAAAVRPRRPIDAAQAGRRVRGVDPFEDGRLGRGHEVLQRSVSLKYSQLSRREHDREHHAERGRLAVVAAEAVLEGVAVDEQQDRDGRVVRSAAGEEERLEEHLRGRDHLQDQHDEEDAAQLRQRDVPDLVPDRRRRRPRPRRTARAARSAARRGR